MSEKPRIRLVPDVRTRSNVRFMPTVARVHPHAILDNAKNQGFKDVVVIGRGFDRSICWNTSYAQSPEAMWDVVSAMLVMQGVSE